MNVRDSESAEPDITTAPIPASRMSHTALPPRMFITLPSNHRTLITVAARNLGVGDPVVRVLSDLDILCSAKHMSQDLPDHANHDAMFSNSQVRHL